MNTPQAAKQKYQGRVGELAAAVKELTVSRPTGAAVGKVLRIAGDLIRRSNAVPAQPTMIDAAVVSLTAGAVGEFLSGVRPSELVARLTRAAEEAVEGGLPDTPEDGAAWTTWALDGLIERDALESVLSSLERRAALGKAEPYSGQLRMLLDEVDLKTRCKVRWFVAVNPHRRAERDLLDDAYRARAWWFTARSECDDLLLRLAGDEKSTPHLNDCPDCQQDLAASKRVNGRRTRHLTSDELWKYDLGMLGRSERAFVEKHSETCAECSLALRALSDAEEAIVGFSPPQPAPTPRARPRGAGEPEVLQDGADFRVLLFRRPDHYRMIVQPRGDRRVAAAAFFLPDAPHRPVECTPCADGLQAELPAAKPLRGAVKVRIEWDDQSTPYEGDVLL